MGFRSCLMMLIAVSLVVFAGCGSKEATTPHVIKTIPENGAQDVDPSLSEISVTFSEPMLDKSWSWCMESRETFPKASGNPQYSSDLTTCSVGVALESGKEYTIWFNRAENVNFKSKSGTPSTPYKLTFKTK